MYPSSQKYVYKQLEKRKYCIYKVHQWSFPSLWVNEKGEGLLSHIQFQLGFIVSPFSQKAFQIFRNVRFRLNI